MSKIWDALQKVEQNRDGDPVPTVQAVGRGGLTQKQIAAVRALLETGAVANAAEISGVTERTLRKWLEQPGFVAAYHGAARSHWAQSLQRLRAMTGQAVEVLRTALGDDDPMVRIRAAAAILRAATVDPEAAPDEEEAGPPQVDEG